MSQKTVCSVPASWDLTEYARRPCGDNSHKHLSRAQVRRCESEGRVLWLRRPDSQGKGGVLTLQAPPPGRVIDRVMIRGASCFVGGAVVIAAARGELWARVMLAHMGKRVRETVRLADGSMGVVDRT